MIFSNVFCTVIFLVLLSFCEMHKILVISHVPIKSHAVLINALVKILLDAGHEITQITLNPRTRNHPNLRQIDVSYNEHYFRDKGNKLYTERSKKIFTATLKHADVQKLLRDTKLHFNLIIAEWMHNDLGMGLAALYDCPLIWFSALEPDWSVLQEIEAAVVQYNSTSIQKSYYISQLYKMRELHLNSFDLEGYNTIFKPLMALRGKSLPSYIDIVFMYSMVFVYSPVLTGHPSTWPATFKPLGGYHISPKVTPLPKDFQSLMDKAKWGVIYFSLGSHLRSEIFPKNLEKNLLGMFSKLKQTIIWKHEPTSLQIPNNVYMTEWAPQRSILAHPKCVLFITQGGILSLTEAVYYGVPVIGIPIFIDQFPNVKKAVIDGVAKEVHPSPTMVKELRIAIEEIFHNSSYLNNVKQQSTTLYHKRRMPLQAEVLYWVNHVIRQGSKKWEPDDSIFSDLSIQILSGMVTVIIALKYIFRRSVVVS